MNLCDAKYDDGCAWSLPRCEVWRPGFIYVARTLLRKSGNHTDGFYCWKVGYTENLPLRAQTLAWQHCYFALAALVRGERSDESAAHRALADHRVSDDLNPGRSAREWYDYDSAEFRAWKRALPTVWRGWVVREVNSRLRPRRTKTSARIRRVWDRVVAQAWAEWETCSTASFAATTSASTRVLAARVALRAFDARDDVRRTKGAA